MTTQTPTHGPAHTVTLIVPEPRTLLDRALRREQLFTVTDHPAPDASLTVRHLTHLEAVTLAERLTDGRRDAQIYRVTL